MKRNAVTYLLIFFFFAQSLKAYSQIKISGPECIVPGTEYQYDLYGKWDKQSEINVCVEGGLIATDNSLCYQGKAVSYVRIIWDDSITKGKISITSSSGNGSFKVRPTKGLQGGKIDQSSKLQLVQLSAIPETIGCDVAKGGNCAPSFEYQWEQSDDNLHWSEVNGAVFKNLSFAATLNRTVFYRRKIFDTSSNTIAYSDVAIVAVN